MALHRDIFWVGRQWAVTGYGIQACDQRQKGKFDIEASLLWEGDVLESLRAHAWLNIEDFEKALSVARQRFPELPGKIVTPVPDATALAFSNGNATASPPQAPRLEETQPRKVAPVEPPRGMTEVAQPEPPKVYSVSPPRAAPKFQMRFAARARFARPWRVRLKR